MVNSNSWERWRWSFWEVLSVYSYTVQMFPYSFITSTFVCILHFNTWFNRAICKWYHFLLRHVFRYWTQGKGYDVPGSAIWSHTKVMQLLFSRLPKITFSDNYNLKHKNLWEIEVGTFVFKASSTYVHQIHKYKLLIT